MAGLKLKPWLRRLLRPEPSKLSPGSRATCAITVDRPKTAALCFDRLYTPDKSAPPGIAIRDWFVLFDNFGNPRECSVEQVPPGLEVDAQISPETLRRDIQIFPGLLVKAISKRGFAPTLYYESEKALPSGLFGKGDARGLAFALSNLGIVSEDRLEWKQIIDFRSDKDSQLAYCRLMRWYDEQVGDGATLAEVENTIALALDDYRASLKKHGIHTFVGPIAAWIGGSVAANSVAAALLRYVDEVPSEWVTPVTIGTGVAACAANLRKVQLDRQNIQRNPLAYVHELSKLSHPKIF